MKIKQFMESAQRVQPYKSNPLLSELAKKFGLNTEEILKLNSNENLFLSREFLQELITQSALELDPRLYPLEEDIELRQKISEKISVETDQIIISAGGDQAIELLFSFLQTGDQVTLVTPTFSIYRRTALQRNIDLKESSLEKDFSLDIKKTLKIALGSSLLVLCNPNNPTGNQFPKKDVIDLIEGFNNLVLLDEAYQEYSDYSLIELCQKYENLIVLRTFSKAYGLAGLRLGYLVTNKKLATMLRERYFMPYPVSNIVLKTGYKILNHSDLVMGTVKDTIRNRDWLILELNKINGVYAFNSKTNFVFFKTEKPYNEIYDFLLSRGIIVSRFGSVLGMDNCLRVTVAPINKLEKFIDVLKEVMLI